MELVLQPSAQRVFSAAEYVRAGARLDEDLSACDIILAVKEVPRELFAPGKTYAFFSHTIKGQPYNLLAGHESHGVEVVLFRRRVEDAADCLPDRHGRTRNAVSRGARDGRKRRQDAGQNGRREGGSTLGAPPWGPGSRCPPRAPLPATGR